MRLHKHTSIERMRSFPPHMQVGMVASEVLRAANLLTRGGSPEASSSLMRARELLGALEVSPNIPVEWAPCLLGTARALDVQALLAAGPAAVQRLHDDLMALCGEGFGL